MTERQSEAVPKRARGRPKGSGKNDAALLRSIRGLLSADQTLKTTTAIKLAGIRDPSAVRRLRDKLRSPDLHSPDTARPSPAVALATARPASVTAEFLPQMDPPKRSSAPEVRVAEPTVPAVSPLETAPAPKHPPLAAETEKRTREALLLATYLEALARSPQADPLSPPAPQVTPRTEAREEPRPTPRPEPRAEPNMEPPQPAKPQAEPHQQQPSPHGFSFPGMPPFLQPFRQPTAAPLPGTSQGQQLEGMKLAVEAMTVMTRLQLHITENAMAYSPVAMMLQGQAFVGQMLLASFTGQLDALKPKTSTEKK